MTVTELRQKLEQRKGRQAQIQQDIQRTEKQLQKNKQRLSQHERALEIVKQVGLQTQKQLEYHLAEQVSLALAAVFDDPYTLKINFQEKRGKTEAELLFKRRNLVVPPLGFVGGGVRGVASLALRVAYWTMRQNTQTRPVLFLDEPFARLKGEIANKRALILLNEISQELKIQIIMISDERISREDILNNANKTFLVSQQEGISKIKEL
jgi:DNA repair exonuclease SbcCD ATPase subunit